MAIDPSVLALLDEDLGVQVREDARGHQHAMERLRSGFDQDGRALGAAIGNNLVLGSMPEMTSMAKLADRTPSPPAPPEPANKPT